MGAGSQGWEGEGAPEGFARRGWVLASPSSVLGLAWAGAAQSAWGHMWDPCGTRVAGDGGGFWSLGLAGAQPAAAV